VRVEVIQCPQCSVWLAVAPLQTQQHRAKHCPLCNADFSFTNNELTTQDVTEALAARGYFTDTEAEAAKAAAAARKSKSKGAKK
jgi:hypothetical protein